MFKKKVTRPVPEGTETRVENKKLQAKIKLHGKTVWVPINSNGNMVVETASWYGTVRMASGLHQTFRLFNDKSASQAELANLQRVQDRIAAGILPPVDSSKDKIADLFSRFMDERKQQGLSAYHLKLANARVKKAIEELSLNKVADVRNLTPAKLSAWLLGMKEAAPMTRKHRKAGLRKFLGWLKDQRLIAEVPRFPAFKAEIKTKRRALTKDEVERLADAAPWPRNLLYRLAFASIARRGAILSLLAKDLHFENPTKPWIMLREETSKTGVGQAVPIPIRLVSDLRKRVAEVGDQPLFAGINAQLNEMAFDKDLENASLPKETSEGTASFHCLRHSGATELLKAGVSTLVVQRMGGWKSLDMLAKHYAHITPMDGRHLIDEVFK